MDTIEKIRQLKVAKFNLETIIDAISEIPHNDINQNQYKKMTQSIINQIEETRK